MDSVLYISACVHCNLFKKDKSNAKSQVTARSLDIMRVEKPAVYITYISILAEPILFYDEREA